MGGGGGAEGWDDTRRTAWPGPARLVMLCGGGGGNCASKALCKEDTHRLAMLVGLDLRVAHSPPYCSKHNPI